MNYLISILLIIIVVIFAFLKTEFNKELFEDSNNIDLYVITLGKEERIQNIKNQQKKINNKIEIFDAVNGLNLDKNDLIKNNLLSENHNLSKNNNKSKREIGVYLSNLNIYKKIKENNKKGYTIIFEDDFLINSDNLIDEIKKAIDTLNNKNIDFDFLFLGNTTNNYGVNIIDNLYNIDVNNNLYGLYGYLINNKNIDKIIDKTKQIDRPIDNIIQDLSYNKIFNTIIIYPHLINHDYTFKSTVNNETNII
jgi:GR25 family glycosyltransferase involved in LPS biosynthesis